MADTTPAKQTSGTMPAAPGAPVKAPAKQTSGTMPAAPGAPVKAPAKQTSGTMPAALGAPVKAPASSPGETDLANDPMPELDLGTAAVRMGTDFVQGNVQQICKTCNLMQVVNSAQECGFCREQKRLQAYMKSPWSPSNMV
jgi:hypothetical protein